MYLLYLNPSHFAPFRETSQGFATCGFEVAARCAVRAFPRPVPPRVQSLVLRGDIYWRAAHVLPLHRVQPPHGGGARPDTGEMQPGCGMGLGAQRVYS